MRDFWVVMGAALLLAGVGCTRPERELGKAGDADEGRIVAALAGGCGCHTPDTGPVGAGGVEIETPFGVFYSTNITSDDEAGLGRWSDAEIEGALRRGVLRDGSVEAPVMPYYHYSGMSDEDVRNLIAWMRALPPSPATNRPHEVSLPLPRVAFWGWRTFLARMHEPTVTSPTEKIARGKYLTNHVSICGDCHTPRNVLGVPERSEYLSGAKDGPLGDVPNITPDKKTGVGDWDQADMVSLLQDGMLPDLDNVQGKMGEVVDGIAGGPGYVEAPEQDLAAIAAYLATVPPIAHDVD